MVNRSVPVLITWDVDPDLWRPLRTDNGRLTRPWNCTTVRAFGPRSFSLLSRLTRTFLINTGWIFAPRRPYRPHRDSAFQSGALAIWAIPVSAAVIPLISSAEG